MRTTSGLAGHSKVRVVALHLRKSHSEVLSGPLGKVKVAPRPNEIKLLDVCFLTCGYTRY